MTIWHLAHKPTLSLRSFVTDGRQAPPFHEIIKSGLSPGAGIAAELRGDPKRQPQVPRANSTAATERVCAAITGSNRNSGLPGKMPATGWLCARRSLFAKANQ